MQKRQTGVHTLEPQAQRLLSKIGGTELRPKVRDTSRHEFNPIELEERHLKTVHGLRLGLSN